MVKSQTGSFTWKVKSESVIKIAIKLIALTLHDSGGCDSRLMDIVDGS